MKNKKSINLKEFTKDIDSIFKKHGIKTGILVAESILDDGKYLLSSVNHENKKEEKALLLSVQSLFQIVNLSSKDINLLSDLLNIIHVELKPKKNIKKSKK
jgi:hypothetical protein